MALYCPKRGDVIRIPFSPQAGNEQPVQRTALVVSPESYNRKVGLVLACPVTSQVKGYPFEVIVPDGFKASGAILSDQVKSLDWRVRQVSLLCPLPQETVQQVLNKLGTLLET